MTGTKLLRSALSKIAVVFSSIVFAVLGFGLQAWAKTVDADAANIANADESTKTELAVSSAQSQISDHELDQFQDLLESVFAIINAIANIPHEIPTVHPLSVPMPQDRGIFNPGIGNHHFNHTSIF